MNDNLDNIRDMTNEQLCDLLIKGPLIGSRTAEEHIKHASEGKDARGYLLIIILDYLITDTFEVGQITVGRVGFSLRESTKWSMWVTGNREHWIGGRDTQYGTREKIMAIAERENTVLATKSEDTTITFPTGELLFANHFHPMDELPEDIKWASEYSINGPLGRMNTMKWLAQNRGIAYGQMGNMSCSVYKVNDDRIIITDAYMDDTIADDEDCGITLPEGEHIGDLCLGVWRFEAVDKADIVKHKFDLSKMDSDEPLSVTVKPGTWELKVYYQQRSDKELIAEFGFPLYAELNRKE